MTRTVLLTGFEPFDGANENPSALAVELAAERWVGPEALLTAVLPVSFERSAAMLEALLDEHSPDVVIAVGLAGGRSAVSIERVAVNLIDARIPDADGAQPVDVPSLPGAAPGGLSSLPVKAITAAILAAGIPAELSLSAGLYVCNHAFMHLTAWADARRARAGFIHVPWALGQAPRGEPELQLEQLTDALMIAMRVALDTPEDLRTPGAPIS